MVQFFPLLCCNLSVFAFSDPVQSQIHDPDPFQLLYLISQIPAHSADLPVQSLCQYDSKPVAAGLLCQTRPRLHIQFFQINAFRHLFQKFRRDLLIDRDNIFLLMIIAGTHNFIQNIAVIRHQQQAF